MKIIIPGYRPFLLFLLSCLPCLVSAQTTDSSTASEVAAFNQYMDSLERFDRSIPYREGKVDINSAVTLNIPKGYKFIPEAEAQKIVTDIWQNPEDKSVLGMVVPAGFALTDLQGWAFIVSYEESGYVKDDDAKDIDYDALLKEMQSDEKETNEQRVAQGYKNIYLLGWAVKPFYDKERKILHWAKKFQFGDNAPAPGDLTLNYDVRILGRKGILSMNAVGNMSQLDTINKHIPDVLGIATFREGYAYSDFNPSVDKVAAYTVGGLIAGKLLAKAGIFVLLLKNIKLVLLAIAGLFGAFRKRIVNLFSRKKETLKYAPALVNPQEEPIAGAGTTTEAQDTPITDRQDPV